MRRPPARPTIKEKIRAAKKNLREAGFDDDAVDRAARALEPRLNHKDQIRKIVARLDFPRMAT